MKAFRWGTVLILFLISSPVISQPLEFGDAPEGAIAYPSSGMIGAFPTCLSIGPGSWIQHNNFGARFGPSFDFEPDGNGGICPLFAPYDMDECYADGDAGLMFPQPYTIVNNVVVPCANSAGTPLGYVCQVATWGQQIDIMVTNMMPSQTIGFVNVLFDWDHNGQWSGAAPCPGGPAAEHVLVNFPIPNGFSGLLSTLGPPPFLIGPFGGYCWARFSITEIPVNPPWDGSGAFEDGESEDYLISVIIQDFGDAPEGYLAYPASGILGGFPTCVGVGPTNSFVQHQSLGMSFGPNVDDEADGNANLCSPFSTPYDNDECMSDMDAGLIVPFSYTITGPQGSEAVTPCFQGMTGTLDTICGMVAWGAELDIHVNNFYYDTAYFNLLCDWNQDGAWLYDASTICVNAVPEHVVVNFVIPPGFAGPVSGLLPPPFQAGPNSGFVWTRFSLSEVPVTQNWDGAGSFGNGESEDYLLELYEEPPIEADMGDAPEGALAYPASGIIGNFPTCLFYGSPFSFIQHFTTALIFSPAFDFEADGNAGICNPYAMPYDNDECMGDGDAGLLMPAPYTITGTPGNEVVVPCLASGSPLDTTCYIVKWGTDLDIQVVNNNNSIAFFNLLIDWNQDGQWVDLAGTQCNSIIVPEHAVTDFVIPPGFAGPISALGPPSFQAGPFSGYVWSRFSLTMVPVGQIWNASGIFEDGETEDYLLDIELATSTDPLSASEAWPAMKIIPNPSRDGFTVSFAATEGTCADFRILNLQGREVFTKTVPVTGHGTNKTVMKVHFSAMDELPAGAYILEQRQDGIPVSRARLIVGR